MVFPIQMDTEYALKLLDFQSIDVLTLQELKRRYRQKAKKLHPDKKGGTEKDFVVLQEAYTLLKSILEEAENELAEIRRQILKTSDLKERAKLERRMKLVDKSELVARLIESEKTLVLHQSIISRQNKKLRETRALVEELVNEYKHKQATLKNELDSIISKLQEEYSLSLLQKIFFFLPRPDIEEMEERKFRLMRRFEDLSIELENRLSKEIVKMYGSTLNELHDSLNLLDVEYETNRNPRKT